MHQEVLKLMRFNGALKFLSMPSKSEILESYSVSGPKLMPAWKKQTRISNKSAPSRLDDNQIFFTRYRKKLHKTSHCLQVLVKD
jgi:hypothetical protein